MSQRDALPPAQARVLAYLERSFPDAHSARDAAGRLGMDVPTALAALQALHRLGYARPGPGAPTGTPEAEGYEAVTAPR